MTEDDHDLADQIMTVINQGPAEQLLIEAGAALEALSLVAGFIVGRAGSLSGGETLPAGYTGTLLANFCYRVIHAAEDAAGTTLGVRLAQPELLN